MPKLTKANVHAGMFIAGSAHPVQVMEPPTAAPRYGTPDLTEIRAKIASFDEIGERMASLKTKLNAVAAVIKSAKRP